MANLLLGIVLFLACGAMVFIIVYFATRQYSVPRSAFRTVVTADKQHDLLRQAWQCPWCGNADYDGLNPPYVCPACRTVHHWICWEKYGGCSIFDCEYSPVSASGKPRQLS
ncbi:MAG: hypothetical protein PHO26_07605 [Dehalococcoidia bacterium]|nr:hypothetical protein [Dehalococcoidia bacterium]MDD5493323.1 hypothetical protein [Dehalococcoidia bacterium]